ncbi:MAG: glycosyltransferase [Deltaproteobacteria bacterium]|nr:glycosyltransferase [Deltaproteobacteria bacterium]
MNVLMLTNTYSPHVGGVARSVDGFASELRKLDHRVLIAAPVFQGSPKLETDVIRFPAVQRFNGSDFSLPLPTPGKLARALRKFRPDVVHSHHPFLLGDTALRVAATRKIPIVFTHHTIYDKYTHYVPGDSPKMKRFIIELVTGYCNLCAAVIAPSQSVAQLLRLRGVTTRMAVIPTGVDFDAFAKGDGQATRRRLRIPQDAFVVGHVGRLAQEKNLHFLSQAVASFLLSQENVHFLVVGDGPSRKEIQEIFSAFGLRNRLRMIGVVDPRTLPAIYHAFDVFAFSSHSETQGMVLTEAMAAGVPVVALDASGVREVVRDRINGRLLPTENSREFVGALSWIAALEGEEKERLREEARKTAHELSMSRTALMTLMLYKSLVRSELSDKEAGAGPLRLARRRIAREREILRNVARAVGDAVLSLPGKMEG